MMMISLLHSDTPCNPDEDDDDDDHNDDQFTSFRFVLQIRLAILRMMILMISLLESDVPYYLVPRQLTVSCDWWHLESFEYGVIPQ